MGDFITFDVIDRPAGGAWRAHRLLHRTPRPAGCRGLVTGTTNHFRASLVPAATPRRLAVLGAWEDEAAAERSPVPGLALGAREHWHLRGELAKVTDRDAWGGWVPSAEGAAPLRDEEPLFVLISGELRATAWWPFIKDAVGAVAHAEEHPGYLGGFGMFSSWVNTTSCSAWRSVADSRDYAYRPGGHADAMRRDVAEQRHRTNRFLRIRPRATRGTLDGRDPFAGLLARDAVAA
jgi:hypothetical protein